MRILENVLFGSVGGLSAFLVLDFVRYKIAVRAGRYDYAAIFMIKDDIIAVWAFLRSRIYSFFKNITSFVKSIVFNITTNNCSNKSGNNIQKKFHKRNLSKKG